MGTLCPNGGDILTPHYINPIMLRLVWVNPNPKRSRRKFRANLRVVPDQPVERLATVRTA